MRGAARLAALGAVVIALSSTWTAPDSAAKTPRPNWQRYLLAPRSGDARPVRVTSVAGSVTNAGALVGHGAGSTRLTKSAGGPDPVVVLDYGRDVGGVPHFDVTSESGSPMLHAAYSEALDFLTLNGDTPVLTGAFGEDLNRYDDYRVERAGRITNARIQGAERFQAIRLTTPGTVTLRSAGIRFTSLNTAYQGYFLSSSEAMNRIWYQSAYTVQLDSLPSDSEPGVRTPPVIVDGAKRDRKVWGGDLLTAAQNVYYSTGAGDYVKGSLAVLARGQSPEGEISGHATQSSNEYWSEAYSMTWVSALAEYYRYTGDLRFVREQWPAAQRELAWNASHVDARGLLITHGFTWHPVDGQMFDGAITADNALYYHVLKGAAELADALGNRTVAYGYRRQAADLKDAVNRDLFDVRTGVYDIGDTRRGPVAQDANALAVLYGIAPDERVDGILRVLRERLWTAHGPLAFSADSGLLGAYAYTGTPDAAISPFASSLELWARLAADDTSGGLDLLRTLWGPMADPDSPYYTATTWEILNSSGQPGFASVTSLSHAWAAGAGPGLSAYVLGLRPESAGYRTWTVAPEPGDLTWAEGRAPTPRGPLAVSWQSHGDTFAMRVSAPTGTSGTIAVPCACGRATVRVNGRVVWDDGRFRPAPGIEAVHQDDRHIYLDTTRGGTFAVRATL